MTPVATAWLNKSDAIRAALSRYNQEPIPWLRTPPPGSGIKIRVPIFGPQLPPTTWELKRRGLRGAWIIDDRTLLLSRIEPWKMIHDGLVRQIRESEKDFGYMRHPRNYYLIDSLEVSVAQRPWDNSMAVMWKLWWVVMPKSWRKKMWKARQRRADG